MATTTPAKVGEPTLRLSARAHTIAEIESELARIWAGQDLRLHTDDEDDGGRHVRGADERDEPRRRRAPAGTGRTVRGHDPAADRTASVADDRHPVGRSGRPVVARCPDRGALHLAARRCPRDLRRDDPPHCRRRGRPAPVGDRHAADRPRPAGDGLVAGRTAAHQPGGAGPPRGSRSTHRRRLDLERRRTRAPARDGGAGRVDAPGDQRLRARPAVPLARGHRLDLRRSGLPAVPPLAPPDRGDLRRPTTRSGAPGSTNLVKPIYHVGWLASRLGLSVVKPLAPVAGTTRPRAAERPGAPAPARPRPSSDGVSPRRCRTAGPRSRSSCARSCRRCRRARPCASSSCAERRGSELRTDVTAEAETVHVRVWQDGVEALDRHFRAPRRSEVDLLAEAIESGRRDPVAVGALRSAADAGRTRSGQRRERARDRRRRRPASRRGRGGRPDRDDPGRGGRGARASRLGDDRRLVADRHLPAPRRRAPLRDAVPWADVHVWWGDDRYVPRDHPLLERQAVRRHHPGHRRRRGRHGRRGAITRACRSRRRERPPVPDRRGDRRGAWRRRGVPRRSPTSCAEAPLERATAGRCSTSCCSASAPTAHILSVFPGSPAFDSTELALAIPAPTHIEPAGRAGDAQPGRRRRRAPGHGRRVRRRRRRPPSAGSSARSAIRGAGRPRSRAARGRSGSSMRRPRADCRR